MNNPELDGVTHINIYSKGKTEIGRLLSNFAHTPINIPRFGNFESIEGYWYWLSVDQLNPRRDELRKVYGFEAKKLGRELRGEDYPKRMNFEVDILDGLISKFDQIPGLKEMLQDSELPFTHYYCYGNKVVEVEEGKFILDYWEIQRKFLKRFALFNL